jgi:CBS domain-containing protein
VVDVGGCPVGMVTKTDMTKAVQSGRLPSESRARDFMSAPVITVEGNPRLGRCLRLMLKSGFQHICLTEDGTQASAACGVISERDLMLYYGNNPMVIIRQIGEINSFEELSHLRHRADMLILHELRNAKGIDWFADVVHDLNRAFVKKVIRLAMDSLRMEGHYLPQSSFCLFFAGCGGRKELFTRSAMDRGLLYQADDPRDESYCAAYYRKLSNRIHEGLQQCGWTLNDKGNTEKNPLWCQPLEVWKGYFDRWIEGGDETELAGALHWFDLLLADGLETLLDQLLEFRRARMEANPVFFRRLALLSLRDSPQPVVFESFNRREKGKNPPLFDLDAHVIRPMLSLTRVLAYGQDIHHLSSTYLRLRALAEQDAANRSLFEEAGEGFRVALFVIARKGLRDQSPGNWIDPSELSSLEIQLVKSTFRSVVHLQNLVESRFPSN